LFFFCFLCVLVWVFFLGFLGLRCFFFFWVVLFFSFFCTCFILCIPFYPPGFFYNSTDSASPPWYDHFSSPPWNWINFCNFSSHVLIASLPRFLFFFVYELFSTFGPSLNAIPPRFCLPSKGPSTFFATDQCFGVGVIDAVAFPPLPPSVFRFRLAL